MCSIALNWGSTPSERALSFLCDKVLPNASFELYRAVSVEAPSSLVFRWLCQLRVAPYSYDFLDNRGRRSPRELTAGLDELAIGQRILTVFTLAGFDRDEQITMRIMSGRPKALFGDLAVTYAVVPDGALRCRLVVKLRVDLPDDGLVGRVRRWLLAWGDLVMMRKQLLTLKKLAERTHGARA
jgi:hypothetical protein